MKNVNFLHLLIDMFEDSFNVLVLPDQLHSSLWTNASDGVAVVAPQQNTQVNELKPKSKLLSCYYMKRRGTADGIKKQRRLSKAVEPTLEVSYSNSMKPASLQ